MLGCEGDIISKFSVSDYEDVGLRGCQNIRMSVSECQDVDMGGCQNIRMSVSECQDVDMGGCQNIRMSVSECHVFLQRNNVSKNSNLSPTEMCCLTH